MKNSIVRAFLRGLANAPSEALKNTINALPAEDKGDALRLAEAIGVRLAKGGKTDEENQ